MANLKGTSGRDVFVITGPDYYDALEGDDEVTIKAEWGTAQGGPGNDLIIVDPSIRPQTATVHYWSSNRAILVDLEQGYALDGFGGRDTLINVRSVHGFKQPGDQGLGSKDADYFWLGPWKNQRSGLIAIDGRGGSDSVTISWQSADPDCGQLIVVASPDKRLIRAWHEKTPGFIYELRNIEVLGVYDNTTNRSYLIDLDSRVSYADAGQQILLRGAAGWQVNSPGATQTISFGFLTERPASGAEGGAGFNAFSADQQQAVRAILTKLSSQVGINFVETTGAQAQMRFGINQQSDTRGYSFLPDFFRGDQKAGDVWLDVETATLLKPGQEGYFVLLHEIGHALGLQHPLGESDTSGATVLLKSLWTLTNTIMIQDPDPLVSGTWPSWFGGFDISALRYLYGKRSAAVGDDRYTLASIQDANGMLSIVDDGGVDWLDASASTMAVTIDLRAGKSSSIGAGVDGTPYRDNVTICVGVEIENAVGSKGDDLLIGNDLPNTIRSFGGNDVIDGLGGLDVVVLQGKRSAWTLDKPWEAARFAVASDGAAGSVEMLNIERIRFDDSTVAFDLGKADTAGQAMLLIGAVIGREAVLTKQALMGQVIGFLDGGFTLQQLAGAVMRLPIWGGVLTPTDSPQDIARHLLRQTSGREPTAAEIATAAAAISSQPQGSYLASLALGEANIAQVNLVGLSSTGFEYPNAG